MLQLKVIKGKEELVFWLSQEWQWDQYDLYSDLNTLNLIRNFCIEYNYKFDSVIRAEEWPGSSYVDEFGRFAERFKDESDALYSLQMAIDDSQSEDELNVIEAQLNKLMPPDVLTCLYHKVVGLQAEINTIHSLTASLDQ